MNQKEMFSQKLSELLNLNTKFIEEYKKLTIPLINFSNKNSIPFQQNFFIILSENHRVSQSVYRLSQKRINNPMSNLQDDKKYVESNLLFLETIKELMNASIAYSEKNGIPVPLKIYHLVFEANKLHQNLISDEILQVDESDEDLTVPCIKKLNIG